MNFFCKPDLPRNEQSSQFTNKSAPNIFSKNIVWDKLKLLLNFINKYVKVKRCRCFSVGLHTAALSGLRATRRRVAASGFQLPQTQCWTQEGKVKNSSQSTFFETGISVSKRVALLNQWSSPWSHNLKHTCVTLAPSYWTAFSYLHRWEMGLFSHRKETRIICWNPLSTKFKSKLFIIKSGSKSFYPVATILFE